MTAEPRLIATTKPVSGTTLAISLLLLLQTTVVGASSTDNCCVEPTKMVTASGVIVIWVWSVVLSEHEARTAASESIPKSRALNDINTSTIADSPVVGAANLAHGDRRRKVYSG